MCEKMSGERASRQRPLHERRETLAISADIRARGLSLFLLSAGCAAVTEPSTAGAGEKNGARPAEQVPQDAPVVSTPLPEGKAAALATQQGVPKLPERSADREPNAPMADDGDPEAIRDLKAAVLEIQNSFEAAQTLSPEPGIRRAQAAAIADALSDHGPRSQRSLADSLQPATDSPRWASTNASVATMRATLDESVFEGVARSIAEQLVRDAASVEIPSLVSSEFHVDAWQGVQIRKSAPVQAKTTTPTSEASEPGSTASVLVIGRYARCFEGGALPVRECGTSESTQWHLAMRRGSDRKWRILEREGISAGRTFDSPAHSTPTREETVR